MDEVKLLPSLGEVHAFLLGEGSLEGCWFGDDTRPPFTSSQPFWWRTALRAAIEATRPTDEVVERVARALHQHEWQGQPKPDNFATDRAYWIAAAEAAIAAMKEGEL